MTLSQWALFVLLCQLLMFVKLWKLFKKAGYAPYLAAVPIYNSVILLRIIGRPSWWVILLYFPIINLLMLPVVWVETARKFGKDSMTDSFLAWATLGLYGFYLNYASDVTYNPEQSVASKTKFGQFVGSIVYAVVIATVVHTYFMQPYIIPTGSLEKTLLVGDFLLVSKFHYGARAPQTVVSFPMVHDTIPLVRTRSYLKKPQLPYMRLPGLQQIKRNDIVVFSWPADTVRQFFKKEAGVVKPIDKKSNYVKRCVAIPGDTLTIEDGIIHINGKESNMPDRAKPIFGFKAYNAKGISARRLINAGYDDLTRKFLITNISQPILDALRPNLLMIANPDPSNYQVLTGSKGLPLNIVQQYRIQAKELLETQKNLFLTLKEAEELPNVLKLDSLKRNINTTRTYNDAYFPNNVRYNWNEDQFGPLVMPEKGVTVQLNPKNVALYKKIISDYELNDLEVSGDDIKINGATAGFDIPFESSPNILKRFG